MQFFKNLYSKFVTVVVIFLVLIGANSLVARVSQINEAKKSANSENSQEMVKDQDSTIEEASDQATNQMEQVTSPEDSQNTNSPDNKPIFEEDLNLNPGSIEPLKFVAQVDGQNAFELLQSSAQIEFKKYDFGVFVESINGVKGNDSYFWAFYLNGEQAQAGADQTTLKKGDTVEWRYEEIK
ncbi:DUF4430 domain-containing protein [Candidatus Woesebacteria bacterium]|nr:DUF4430 domain-containing protein [Candidatus Woesebacteria bacterium]